MDGKGHWMDNVFIERSAGRRSLKCECSYLHAFETGSERRDGIGKRMAHDNAETPHSALGGRTPLEAHAGDRGLEPARDGDGPSVAEPRNRPRNGDHLCSRGLSQVGRSFEARSPN